MSTRETYKDLKLNFLLKTLPVKKVIDPTRIQRTTVESFTGTKAKRNKALRDIADSTIQKVLDELFSELPMFLTSALVDKALRIHYQIAFDTRVICSSLRRKGYLSHKKRLLDEIPFVHISHPEHQEYLDAHTIYIRECIQHQESKSPHLNKPYYPIGDSKNTLRQFKLSKKPTSHVHHS